MLEIHGVYPYLRVHSAAEAIEFYSRAFGATEQFRLTEPSGRIGHAEIKLGPTTVMLADEYPEQGIRGPRSLGGTTFSIHVHVDDVDHAFAQVVNAGATIVRPLQDQFYGERSGTVRDPFGHEWLLGGHIETVAPEETGLQHRRRSGRTIVCLDCTAKMSAEPIESDTSTCAHYDFI